MYMIQKWQCPSCGYIETIEADHLLQQMFHNKDGVEMRRIGIAFVVTEEERIKNERRKH